MKASHFPPSAARLLRRILALAYALFISGPLALLGELAEVFSWRGVTALFSRRTWLCEARASRAETRRANKEAGR